MDKRLKAKWVKALRSGEYKQGRKKLGGPKVGYCCLGVLCVVGGRSFSRDAAYLPRGFGGIHEDIQHRLASMNDFEGRSFKEIAAWIEKNL